MEKRKTEKGKGKGEKGKRKREKYLVSIPGFKIASTLDR